MEKYMNYQKPTMTAQDAVELYLLFEQNNIHVWIDGGWAVDALIGKQTRPHNDIDIALHHSDVPKLKALLEARGYSNVPRDDTRDCNFVLGDNRGHEIDIHSFELDKDGKNTFGVAYEAAHFGGKGSIEGREVRCINPKTLVEFHTGYPLDEGDHHDVLVLCKKYDIEIPEDHKHWDERQKLVKAIHDVLMPKDRPLIIAVSGFGGSGKTTLANFLKTQFRGGVGLVCIDSFSNHEWRRNADWDNFDRDRFAKEILRPARANKFPLKYVHEPWPGEVADEATEVPQVQYLIVEGCSIFHPDLVKYYDFKVWADCPLGEATERGMWRDRHIHKNEHDDEWQNIWMPNECDFLEKYQPNEVADMIVDTSSTS
jgi:lincosamide nucleotidyltransferase A/C/D/E